MKKSTTKLFMILAILLMFVPVFAGELHCNPKTKVCHKEGCRYYNSKSATVVLKSDDEAKAKGFTFCKRCYSSKNTKKKK